jgi:hypothetical protein
MGGITITSGKVWVMSRKKLTIVLPRKRKRDRA